MLSEVSLVQKLKAVKLKPEWMGLLCRSLDAAVVSPGEPTPFPNVRHPPDMSKGISFNLANNIWGTNYIMWQPYASESGTMRFRFSIEVSTAFS